MMSSVGEKAARPRATASASVWPPIIGLNSASRMIAMACVVKYEVSTLIHCSMRAASLRSDGVSLVPGSLASR